VAEQQQPRLIEYLKSDAERSFIHKAYEHKLGDAARLAYAELVEKTDPERAEWLRLEVALHSRATDDPAVLARFLALAHKIGLDFANVMLRDMIMNCGSDGAKKEPPRVRFAFACTKRWETLAPTDSEAVRFCRQCNEHVYYCNTVLDAETRAFAGQSIAIPKPLSDGGVRTEALGRPDPVRDWADRLFSYGPGAPRDCDSLVVIYARDELLGRRYTLNPEGATIGRATDNTIVFDADAISRRHARLERRGDHWWVIDIGSTNGTYVNDEQVQEARLRDGDRLKIGATIFKFLVAGR
jgi:uncharacterized protein (TIGR02996 family)